MLSFNIHFLRTTRSAPINYGFRSNNHDNETSYGADGEKTGGGPGTQLNLLNLCWRVKSCLTGVQRPGVTQSDQYVRGFYCVQLLS